MTEIEKKALALLNECADQEVYGGWTTFDPNQTPCTRALCRAIEQNEALQADNAKLREALVGLTTDEDDDPCWFDHNGNCLAHFITNPCEMAFARAALQETER